jgi:hypothetical protein
MVEHVLQLSRNHLASSVSVQFHKLVHFVKRILTFVNQIPVLLVEHALTILTQILATDASVLLDLLASVARATLINACHLLVRMVALAFTGLMVQMDTLVSVLGSIVGRGVNWMLQVAHRNLATIMLPALLQLKLQDIIVRVTQDGQVTSVITILMNA